jgi:hypothetical protein
MANEAQSPSISPGISARERDLAKRIARLAEAGKFDMIELLDKAVSLQERELATQGRKRVPGRFKGQLEVGPEFFEPMTDEEIREFMGE